MERYFKKPNGTLIALQSHHDLDSLKSRFVECDANGKELKKEKPKPKASKKKAEVDNG